MTKGALAAVPPFALLMIQLGASISFLWIATFATRAEIRLDHGWHKIALSGLLEPGLAYSVGVPGLALTSAASASVIGATEPALTSVLAWILLREKLSWQLAAAIVVAMFGVTLITLNQAGDVGESSMSGNLLIVLGTAFAALYVISSRLLVAQTAPLPLAAMQQTVGFLFALALFVGTWLLGFERLPDALPTTFILLAVLSGIVQYALAFWLYLIGLQVLPAGTAAVFLTLVPVFGVGGAMLFLGESLSLQQWLGCAVIIVAMAAVTLKTRSGPE